MASRGSARTRRPRFATREAGLRARARRGADGGGAPVVFHDTTLDRATDCDGRIDERMYGELRERRVEHLAPRGDFKQLGRCDRRASVPTLARVLDLGRATRSGRDIL